MGTFSLSGRGGTWVARACIALTLAWAARVVEAQGSVSGRVTMLERPGARTTDLASAVVWLEPADGPAAAAPPATGQILMESRTYSPRVQVVTTGSTVGFPNRDPFRHNVFSKSGPREFDLGLYPRGETRSAVVREPGVYPVFCNIHARMVAFIVAVPSAHWAQPGADGRFTIAGVPGGRWTVRAWHERGGQRSSALEVPAGGLADVAVELDARGYRLVQHRNKFGQEYTVSGRDRY